MDETQDFSTVDQTKLHYQHFSGDVIFKVGDADFGTCWGWVPVLDFAVSLYRLSQALADERVVFEFTESEAQIVLTPLGPDVRIEASYVPAVAACARTALDYESRAFTARVIRDLKEAFSSLRGNAYISSLAHDLHVQP